MLIKNGHLDSRGHPFVEIVISLDGVPGSGNTYPALIDTGFTGFIILPLLAASSLNLQANNSTRYELGDGKLCDPVPLAPAFACVSGDEFVPVVVSISEGSSEVIVGVEFLRACKKGLLFLSDGISLIDEVEARKSAAKSAAEASSQAKSGKA